jgi:hypothetical protein
MRTLIATTALAVVLVAMTLPLPAAADIVCDNRGCFETGLTIISNGGAYRGLEYKARLHKDGKVRKPEIKRHFE